MAHEWALNVARLQAVRRRAISPQAPAPKGVSPWLSPLFFRQKESGRGDWARGLSADHPEPWEPLGLLGSSSLGRGSEGVFLRATPDRFELTRAFRYSQQPTNSPAP